MTSGNDRYKVTTMNWKKIILEIMESDERSESYVARKVGSSQSAISRLKLGQTKEPFYEVGLRLVKLHKKLKGRLK